MADQQPSTVREQMALSVYSVTYAPYNVLNLVDTVLPHWIISYILEGDVTTSTLGEQWQIRSGDVMLHPPNLPFSEVAHQPGTHLWIAFDAEVMPHMDMFKLHPVSFVTRLRDTTTFQQTFSFLLKVWNSPESFGRNFRTVSLTLQLFDLVLESWRESGSNPRIMHKTPVVNRFAEVIHYMETHLAEKLSRRTLARLVHLHPGYFDEVFREVYGIPPMQLLRHLRLQKAQHLLEHTDASLEMIAEKCGFTDAAYLSRVFRRDYGQTPGQYRKAVKSTRGAYIPALLEN